MKLALIYALFALIAMSANIGMQDVSLYIYTGPFNIIVSVLAGSAVGLIIKFTLDKKYIFRFRAKNLSRHAQSFTLYSMAGACTTLIFWGFEFGFHTVFGTKIMRFIGGAIGMGIGYAIKYQLDKRFAFGPRNAVDKHIVPSKQAAID